MKLDRFNNFINLLFVWTFLKHIFFNLLDIIAFFCCKVVNYFLDDVYAYVLVTSFLTKALHIRNDTKPHLSIAKEKYFEFSMQKNFVFQKFSKKTKTTKKTARVCE